MIKVVCDRCGAEIPKDGEIWNFQWKGEKGIVKRKFDQDSVVVQFCNCCKKEIEDFINTDPRIAMEREEEREKRRKYSKKRLDHGKIRELKNQGLTNKEIAEKVGSTPGSVAQSLSTHKELAVEQKPVIDKGKIASLFVAGWKIPKIASELQCEEKEIRNALASM